MRVLLTFFFFFFNVLPLVLSRGYELNYEKRTLRVFGTACPELGPSAGDGVVPEKCIDLSVEQATQFFTDAERCRLWDLPCTNYHVDLTDDVYHMGVSVDAVSLQDRKKRFLHRCPIGAVVMVCSRQLTKSEYVAFSSFVQGTAKRVADLSQVPLPGFLKAKWSSKTHMESLE